MRKKGFSQYVAWILLLALAVFLGAIMYSWTRSYAQNQVDNLDSSTDDVVCASVSIDITGICQNPQSLNINVTNNNNLKIEKLQFMFIDLYGNTEKKILPLQINTAETLKGTVLKQGTLASARVTPVVKKKNREIVCQKRSIIAENIIQC